jgi:DNA-binding protein YbaB
MTSMCFAGLAVINAVKGVVLPNDRLRHDALEAVALAEEQLRELAAAQDQRMALTATATAADGLVEVTVNALHTVSNTVVHESYLDEFDLCDLGDHVTAAAQAAAEDVDRMAATLFAPFEQRRRAMTSLSGEVLDTTAFGEFLSRLATAGRSTGSAPKLDDGDDERPRFPQVRG